MLIPVKCFTCGTVIGDKYRYYTREVRRKKASAGSDVDTVKYLTNDMVDKTVEGEILDILGLNKMCCRRHMLTHVDIE